MYVQCSTFCAVLQEHSAVKFMVYAQYLHSAPCYRDILLCSTMLCLQCSTFCAVLQGHSTIVYVQCGTFCAVLQGHSTMVYVQCSTFYAVLQGHSVVQYLGLSTMQHILCRVTGTVEGGCGHGAGSRHLLPHGRVDGEWWV